MIRKATYGDIPALMEICGVILLANGDPREAYQKNL